MIVFDDADIDAVAQCIKVAGYFNTGQECTAATRIIAGPKVYGGLVEQIVNEVDTIKVGEPASSDEIDMGPLISQRQRERVLGFLERAQDAKATVVAGGDAPSTRGTSSSPRSWSTSRRTPRSSRTRCSGRS